MPLSDIEELSDDAPAPIASPAPQTPQKKKGKGKGKDGKEKKKGEKAAGKGGKVGKSPPPSNKKPKIVPKAKPEGLKRPASTAKVRDGADGHTMKKPAAAGKKTKSDSKETDAPKQISVCKSLYKRDGVWSLKLNQKEVIRVT